MITEDQYRAFEQYAEKRIVLEATFSVHPDELSRRFGINQPFWEELDKHAAKRTHLQFVFNGHHWTIDGEPTQIVFERR